MGIDLSVAPIQYATLGWWLCTNRLNFDRDYELHEKIRALESHPVGKTIQWYDDDGIKDRTDDLYGDPLRFVNAERFREVKLEARYSDWNAAVLRCLQFMPPFTPVVLWWH